MYKINWNKVSYSEIELREAVKNSISFRAAQIKVGLCGEGGGYKTFKRFITILKIDTSHFLGCGHLKGKKHNWTRKIELGDILVENSTYNSNHNLKYKLISEGFLTYKCSNQNCKVSDIWLEQPLVLQLDHINGINNDNRIENLRLLCPNCHSQTTTFCRQKKQCPQ